MRTVAFTPKTSLYLTGSRAELERVRAIAAELAQVAELDLSSRWFDGPERWCDPAGVLERDDRVEHLGAVFALVRRAGILWVLWPEAPLNECVAGSLAYALAHRWHVGPRMYIMTSGSTVGTSALALSADFSTGNDAEALAHCVARTRAGSMPSHEDVGSGS